MPVSLDREWLQARLAGPAPRLLLDRPILPATACLLLLLLGLLLWAAAPAPAPAQSALARPAVFMQADNSYRGGVVLSLDGQIYRIVKTNITEKTLKMKMMSDPDWSRSYRPFNIDYAPAPRPSLPAPGVYVTEYGSYDDSEGLIAVQYSRTRAGRVLLQVG